MNNKQWNTAMSSALLGLIAVSIPFFALAQQGPDFGGLSDADFGGLSDADFGGLSDADFGGITDSDFGSIFQQFFGSTGTSSTSTGSTGNGMTGFDPFDDDLGPFDDVPGNPGGDDTIPNPEDGDDDDDDDTPPGPGPTPPGNGQPSNGNGDGLGIFISTIFINNAYDQEPGNTVLMRITFENEGTRDLEDTKVIVVFPNWGARDTVGPFDLDVGEQLTKTLLVQVPEDAENDYVRFLIYNENEQRVKHRQVSIIDY